MYNLDLGRNADYTTNNNLYVMTELSGISKYIFKFDTETGNRISQTSNYAYGGEKLEKLSNVVDWKITYPS